MAAQSMATAGQSSFSDFASSAMSSSSAAAAAVSSACALMSATVSSIRLTIPRIEVGALPHFRLNGRFDPESGSVPSVAVDWYAKGGVFSSASVIGVGEAGPEAVVPLRPSVLRGIGEGIETDGGAQVNNYNFYGDLNAGALDKERFTEEFVALLYRWNVIKS